MPGEREKKGGRERERERERERHPFFFKERVYLSLTTTLDYTEELALVFFS